MTKEKKKELYIYVLIRLHKCMYQYENNVDIHINMKYVDVCINMKVCRCTY
jgi:hypothetical protein